MSAEPEPPVRWGPAVSDAPASDLPATLLGASHAGRNTSPGLLLSDVFGPAADKLGSEPPARLAMNAAWPLLFCYLAAEELAGDRAGAARTAGCALAAVAVLCWSGWSFFIRYRWKQPLVAALMLGIVASAAGLLCPLAPSAVGMLAAVGVAGGWTL
ncbi:MAG TPA: hypothetical protein VMD59_20480, partial [Acidimicrobiales bacterium]|nr:hypothetical protein [Acidimicrobiales bacterium]